MMRVFHKTIDLQKFLNGLNQNISIGFVPTMGALHAGHISLLEKALKENDTVVFSIFVNPTQFNDPEDLKNYPRTINEDVKLLQQHANVVLFAPSVDDIYPNGQHFPLNINLSPLDKVMEGAHRPGHFQGVVTVVKRLFDIIKPHKAYFGQKDFQQLAIVKHLVRVLNIPIEIIGCPTERESDGLAMSSRNRNLTPETRAIAAKIPATLKDVASFKYAKTIQEVRDLVKNKFIVNDNFVLDYFEIADAQSLQPLQNWNEEGNNVACIAVFAGKVRLIDNIVF
jgi:pantoate--beta-alanine ligase